MRACVAHFRFERTKRVKHVSRIFCHDAFALMEKCCSSWNVRIQGEGWKEGLPVSLDHLKTLAVRFDGVRNDVVVVQDGKEGGLELCGRQVDAATQHFGEVAAVQAGVAGLRVV